MKKRLEKKSMHELLAGFSKLTRNAREERLVELGFLTIQDVNNLKKESGLDPFLAEHLIENVIGFFSIPLGVAVNFVIDGKNYIIPMAIEETSVIAAVSKTAKWIRDNGKITTKNLSTLGIGQIQIPKVENFEKLNETIQENKNNLIETVNHEVAKGLVNRGGGVRDITVRLLPRQDGYNMAVLHVFMDTCDAMGANIINQVCEFLKRPIEFLTHEKVGMCILSNLTDTKITQAHVVIKNIDSQLGEAITEASIFAAVDPYRATTNNKGVMNGMDAVIIATGNDWRAVEAGIHAYAARSGQYTSLTKWYMEGHHLHGILEAPIAIGIVGGVTRLHPVAQICLKILRIKTAGELARVIAAVGLVQNLGALNALVTHGIIKGHMKLHISNIAISSGATKMEIPVLKQYLTERLIKNGRISGNDVKEILEKIRHDGK